MYEWRNAKVDANMRKAFEIAMDIAWRFEDIKIRSAYVIFAAFNIEDSIISRILSDMNIQLLPDLNYILTQKEAFAEIFGQETADRFFSTNEDEKNVIGRITNNELAFDGEEDDKEEDEETQVIEQTVMDVLTNLIGQYSTGAQRIELIYSDKLEKACDEAFYRAKAQKLDYISLDVLIYCILENTETSAYRFMERLIQSLNLDMDDFIESIRINSNISDDFEVPIVIPSALENCLEVLNSKYKKGDISPILGRDKEKYKLYNVFSKKTKRNAVLIGTAGVGKTAIVELITQEIVNGTCPRQFVGYTVLSLDVTAMVAGTKYRGEFEAKVAVLKKFLESTPRVILFVDEIHQMLGAGSAEGSGADLSGSLKPILSRDDVVFVGATTTNEYERIVSRDEAFKRRFESIIVKEPKNGEVKAMIEAKIQGLEKHHKVKMPRDLLDYIILCSGCFNMDTANPDKTLDLCDRSMAISKMNEKRKVTKSCVNKVYEEYFEKQCKISEEEVRATSYHEVGHYIVHRYTKVHKARNTIAISIVPFDDYLGVNVNEPTDNIVSHDIKFAESFVMMLLAGRVAQFKVTKAIDAGASNDLMQAKQYVKSVITEYGMDEDEFKNIYLMDDELLNEKLKESINQKVMDFIKKAYRKTEEFVDKHWDEIDKMAKYLMKKKIVTSDELDKFLDV